jgi:hypothetical protein
MKLELFRQIFEKYLNIIFNENGSSGSQVVPYERTDMMKQIVAFRNFVKVPKHSGVAYVTFYIAHRLRRTLYWCGDRRCAD